MPIPKLILSFNVNAYNGMSDEFCKLRVLKARLNRTDQARYPILFAAIEKDINDLAKMMQEKIDNFDWNACYCYKSGGTADPKRFGGYPCYCS